MEGCKGLHPEVGSIITCCKKTNTGTFTTYEGLVCFQDGSIRVFVAERAMEKYVVYRFVRTSERQLPHSGRVIRVFKAIKLGKD